MKRFILSSAIISGFIALSSCEKHDWEDTKLLHVDKVEKHDSHGDAGHGGHSDHGHKEEAH